MIMDASRKYRKVVFWILIILVGIPFIFITTDYIPGAEWLKRKLGATDLNAPVAMVGNVPIMAEELRSQLNFRASQRAQMGMPAPTMAEMAATGEVDRTLQSLVQSKLLAHEAENVDLTFAKSYLEESLRKDPSFQNEKGEFDAASYNQWVKESQEANIDWNALWNSVGHSVRQRILGQRITASARVREGELRDAFERAHTQVRLKYLQVQPAIEPTEADIQAHYDQHKDDFNLPEKRVADFVAFSLDAPRPALLDDLLTRARNGESFTELAKATGENVFVREVPDNVWTVQNEKLQPHEQVLFTLAVGQVSEPVQGDMGWYIYKVTEQRTNEATGQPEVRAQQLVVMPRLSAEERQAVTDRASAFAAKAKEAGDLSAPALEAGLAVQTTDLFSEESEAIANVPKSDVPIFKFSLKSVGLNAVSDVVTGVRNLYVARVKEVQPPVPQPLDAVRDKVREAVITERRSAEDYQKQVEQLATEIKTRAKSLEEARTLFPTAVTEIKETPAFTAKTYMQVVADGPMWNAEAVIEQAGAAAPGRLIGPITDWMRNTYFVELVEKTPPTQEAWTTDYPKEREQIEQALLRQREMERFEDYLTYLQLRGDVPVTHNEAALARVLGLNEPGEESPASEATPSEDAPAAATPADASAEAPSAAPVLSPVEAATPASPALKEADPNAATTPVPGETPPPPAALPVAPVQVPPPPAAP